MDRSIELINSVNNKRNYVIDFSQQIDYKKNNMYSNEMYRQQFLKLFFLNSFDNNVINAKITEIYNIMLNTKRITQEFEQMLNKENVIFSLNSKDEKYNKIMKLKLLFSYDTLDVFIPYLRAMITYDNTKWKETNTILFKSLLKEMNNVIM